MLNFQQYDISMEETERKREEIFNQDKGWETLFSTKTKEGMLESIINELNDDDLDTINCFFRIEGEEEKNE